MMRRAIASGLAVWLFAVILGLTPRADPGTEDYVIEDYELTLEAQENRTDVRVNLDITYLIRSGEKSGGFKYIGRYQAWDLSGFDEEFRSVKTWVSRQRETRLNWSFPPAGPGRKRIRISFMTNALTGSRQSNTLEAAWAGVFKVPVRRGTYRLVFPDNEARIVHTSPPNFIAATQDGRRCVEVMQAPLRETAFRVTFSPGIVASDAAENRLRPASGTSDSGWAIAFVPFALLIALMIVLIKAAKRAARTLHFGVRNCAGGSSGCGSSGGSSCGSSCGGGGCGGGGCGG